LIDIPCHLKFRFLPGFYKKQSEFNDFPENKLTGTVYFRKFYKIRLFSVFIKLGVSIGPGIYTVEGQSRITPVQLQFEPRNAS